MKPKKPQKNGENIEFSPFLHLFVIFSAHDVCPYALCTEENAILHLSQKPNGLL